MLRHHNKVTKKHFSVLKINNNDIKRVSMAIVLAYLLLTLNEDMSNGIEMKITV